MNVTVCESVVMAGTGVRGIDVLRDNVGGKQAIERRVGLRSDFGEAREGKGGRRRVYPPLLDRLQTDVII